MKNNNRTEVIKATIKEMIAEDRYVINSQMAREASERLGETVDSATISRLRKAIGLSMYDLQAKDHARILEKALNNHKDIYLKHHPKDREVVERFLSFRSDLYDSI